LHWLFRDCPSGERRVLNIKEEPYKLYLTWEEARYIIPYVMAKEAKTFPKPFGEPDEEASRTWSRLKVASESELESVTAEQKEYVKKLYEEAKRWLNEWHRYVESPEYKREKEYFVKVFAERLIYPFEKWEAEKHGFKSIEKYKRWKEKVERERNSFYGFYVGEWDQQNIVLAAKSAVEEPETYNWLDPVDAALIDYGYDFARYQPNKAYQFINGKWVYTPFPRKPKAIVLGLPEEERDFPTHNYFIDRKIVEAVLQRYGWKFGVKGWQPS